MTSPDKPLVNSQLPRPPNCLHSESAAAGWQSHGRHLSPPHNYNPNPASSPAPPGFGVGGHQGNNDRISSGIVSGPPGFISEQQGRFPFSGKTVDAGAARNSYGELSIGTQGQPQPQPQKSSVTSALSAEMAQISGDRTSSFVNLAAVFGTGLAESMDDATKGDWSLQNHQQYDALQDLSLARHSRHAATRLIGASPPRVDPLGYDLGGSLLGGGSAAPASLGGVHLSRDLQLAPAHQSNGQPSCLQGGLLPDIVQSDSEGAQSRRDYSPLSMFGTANRRGQLPASKDVGVTVMEPGYSDEAPVIPATGYDDDEGGVFEALMDEQQRYCNDYQCSQQLQKPQQLPYLYDQNTGSPERDTYDVEREMRNLWVDDHASLVSGNSRSRRQPTHPQGTDLSVASSRSGGSQTSKRIAEAELRPFLWDTRSTHHQASQYLSQGSVEPSRCLAILKAAHLPVPEVRARCEAFGVLETFRSDFADRGIIFVSYYDMRCAQYAALDLEGVLKRYDSSIEDNGQGVVVYYCVPLNSSTQTDESRLVLSDVPLYVDEVSLLSMMSSYGAVRSLRKQGGHYGGSSFEVEFQNMQDSKQALLEVSATQPWGPDVAIEVGMRPPIDRKRGRELLAVIGRWRHGSKPAMSPNSSAGRTFEAPVSLGAGPSYYRGAGSSASSSHVKAAAVDTSTQLVLGPDGRYSYVIVNNQSGYPHPPPANYGPAYRGQQQHDHLAQPRQQIVHGPNGEIYITTVALPLHQPPSSNTSYRHGGSRSSREYWPPSSHSTQHSQYVNAPYHQADRRDGIDGIASPYYTPHAMPDHRPRVNQHHNNSHHPHSSNASTASVGGDEKDNKHLVLDLENVENGRDVRTSLMVRNIPNKYTQQMLLAEFTENGLGPGIIDFFYLPIDFKNRCNRGYAFINFVDFKDILPFHRRYFGKHWSTFNSDKICDITYARIQGKGAMLKRFENSALMEKDEEYKPLVFISLGPEKGKRIPFPEGTAGISGRP